MSWPAAFGSLSSIEGGYSNDPDDPGGETYRGISRVYHPRWPGWSRIDYARRVGGGPLAELDRALDRDVQRFYRASYWDPWQGDAIDELSPAIAEEMLDIAVNLGTHRAALWLQQVLNVLNRDETKYPDLVEDGIVGRKTLAALVICVRDGDEGVILKAMNVLQGYHYLANMRASTTQEKYARGWFRRVSIGRD